MLNFLIIEDDRNNRFLLNHMLKKNFECEVMEAENGQIGLNILIDKMPDLILLDISMPVMDGYKTLEIIRTNQVLKNIPVLVITALGDSKVVSNLAEKGICDFLLKPIDIDDSVRRIKKILEKITDDGKDDVKIEEHILIVDEDTRFVQFFKSLLSKQYSIHEAVRGSDGIDVYSKYQTKYVFISDGLSLLDKKILTQKIRELATDSVVSIYLLVDDLTKLSTKVFNYDGIIKRTLDKDLFLSMNEFLREKSFEIQAS